MKEFVSYTHTNEQFIHLLTDQLNVINTKSLLFVIVMDPIQ